MNCKESIKEIVEVLKNRYRPEKIILFGSCASGKLTEDSDIDMLIIKDTKKTLGQRWLEVGRLVRNLKKSMPFEPFVITPKEIRTQLPRNLFLQEIINRGKVLYEKE